MVVLGTQFRELFKSTVYINNMVVKFNLLIMNRHGFYHAYFFAFELPKVLEVEMPR
jgi:hypothetical protein